MKPRKRKSSEEFLGQPKKSKKKSETKNKNDDNEFKG